MLTATDPGLLSANAPGWEWSSPYTLTSVAELGDHGNIFFPGVTDSGDLELESGETVIETHDDVFLMLVTSVVDGAPSLMDWSLKNARMWVTDRRVAWIGSHPATGARLDDDNPLTAVALNALIKLKHRIETRDLRMVGHFRWLWGRGVHVGKPFPDSLSLYTPRPIGSSWLYVKPSEGVEQLARLMHRAALDYQLQLPWLDERLRDHMRDTPVTLDDGDLRPVTVGFRWLGAVGARPTEDDPEAVDKGPTLTLAKSLMFRPYGAPGFSSFLAKTSLPNDRLLQIVEACASRGRRVGFRLRGGGQLSVMKVVVTHRAKAGIAFDFQALSGAKLGSATATCPGEGTLLIYMTEALTTRELAGGWIPVTGPFTACEQRYEQLLMGVAEELTGHERVEIRNLWRP